MTKLTYAVVTAAVAVAMSTSSHAAAAPASPGGAIVPLLSTYRACDYTLLSSVGSVGNARATARVGSTGSGTVFATVDIAPAVPNTHYDVRVIQVPRPSIGCAPGAPGVITGGLQTDAAGAATTTLQGAKAPGATGAWVIVERPAEFSQTPAEFYSSTFVAAI